MGNQDLIALVREMSQKIDDLREIVERQNTSTYSARQEAQNIRDRLAQRRQ